MATVIDSLLVTLGLDASGFTKGAAEQRKALDDIRKGTEGAGKASDEAHKRFTKAEQDNANARRKHATEQQKQFKDTQEQTKKLAGGLNELKGELLAVVAAFTAGQGIKDFIQTAVEGTAALARMSEMLGTTAQQLSNWQGVAQRFGGTAGGAAQALQAIDDINLQIAEHGTVLGDKGGILVRMGLGGQSFATANEGLIAVSDNVYKLRQLGYSETQTRGLIEQVLGTKDPGIIHAVMSGHIRELLAYEQSLRKVTQAQTDAAEKLSGAWADVSTQFEDLKTQVMAELAPALLTITKAFADVVKWLQEHPGVATAIFVALTAAVAGLTVVIGLAAAAAIGLDASMAPIIAVVLAISAVVAGLYFLVQDFFSYTETGKSALDWGPFIPVINAVKQALGAVWDAVKGLFGALQDVGAAIQSILDLIPAPVLKGLGDQITQHLLQPFYLLADVLQLVADRIKISVDLMKGDLVSAAKDFGKSVQDAKTLGKDLLYPENRALGQPGQQRGTTPPDAAGAASAGDYAWRARAAQSATAGGPAGAGAGAQPFTAGPAADATGAPNTGGSGYDGTGRAASYGNGGGAPKSVRNNNPGNLVLGGVFARFATPLLGASAMARQLLADFRNHHQQTVAQIINGPHGWSQEGVGGNSHAGTMNYIASVARAMGLDPNARLNLNDPAQLAKMMEAMAQFEAGKKTPFDPSIYGQAAQMQLGAGYAPGVGGRRGGGGTNVTATTNVNGPININAHGGDPAHIAAGIHAALEKRSFVPQFATGLV